METLRLIAGSKAFATIAGGALLMVLGAALGVAIGSDSTPSQAATTTLATITRNGTTRILAVSAKPKTVDHKFTVTKKKTVDGPGSTSVKTVTGPTKTQTRTVTRTRTQTVTQTVPTTVTETVTVSTLPSH